MIYNDVLQVNDNEIDIQAKCSGASSSGSSCIGNDFEVIDKQHDSAIIALEVELADAKSHLTSGEERYALLEHTVVELNVELETFHEQRKIQLSSVDETKSLLSELELKFSNANNENVNLKKQYDLLKDESSVSFF